MPGDPLPILPRMNARLLLKALFHKPAPSGQEAFDSTYLLEGIDAAQARRYALALGFEPERIPLTYYYLLAQRAHLATMLDRPIPFRIPGIIHVENTLQEHAVPMSGLPLRLDTTVAILPPDEHGAVHCLFQTQARQEATLLFVCSSTYLAVRGRRARKSGKPAEPMPDWPAIASWDLAPSSGRAYASVSGDWNPIHLWPLTARLMGMRSPIIHGMHTVAKACAAMEKDRGKKVSLITASFRSPIPLPSQVQLAADRAGGTYLVTCGKRAAVDGTFAASSD